MTQDSYYNVFLDDTRVNLEENKFDIRAIFINTRGSPEMPSKYGRVVFENNGLISESHVCTEEEMMSIKDPADREYYSNFRLSMHCPDTNFSKFNIAGRKTLAFGNIESLDVTVKI